VVRLLAAVLIIAGVLYLFGAGGKMGAALGGGVRLRGPGNPSSALVPGYRSEPPGGPATTSPSG